MGTFDYDNGTPLQGTKRTMKHKQKVRVKQSKGVHFEGDLVITETLAQPAKHWTPHDLLNLRGKTEHQREALQAYFEGEHLALLGSAGTGKTFLAVYLALRDFTEGKVNRIAIVRSAVQGRDQGFLPGTDVQKAEPYELPYRSIFAELLPKYPNAYDDMKREGVVAFVTTSFLRGLTLRDTVVIVEEAQNLDFSEINTVMTRIGENTRIVFTGDTRQDDLSSKRGAPSGLPLMKEVIKDMGGLSVIEFDRYDIVRSEFVKRWITAVEDRRAA